MMADPLVSVWGGLAHVQWLVLPRGGVGQQLLSSDACV